MSQLHKNQLNLFVKGRMPPSEHLKENFVANKEGLWIWFEEIACANPKGVVFLIHGLAEDSSRHLHVARHLCRAGFYVVLWDLQGCGRSEGERAHCASFDNFISDFYLVVKEVLARRRELASVPKFVQGHSMGGLIAVLSSSPEEQAKNGISWAGLVVTGTAFQPDPKTATPVNRWLARQLGSCMPKFKVFWEKGPAVKYRVSSLDAAQYRYETDPNLAINVRGGLRIGLMYQFLVAMDKAMAQAHSLSVAYLAMHGTKDGFTEIQGTEKWHALTTSADKTFVPVEGGMHEIMNEAEPIRSQVLNRITSWLHAHTKGVSGSSMFTPSFASSSSPSIASSSSRFVSPPSMPVGYGIQPGVTGVHGMGTLMPGHPAYGFAPPGKV